MNINPKKGITELVDSARRAKRTEAMSIYSNGRSNNFLRCMSVSTFLNNTHKEQLKLCIDDNVVFVANLLNDVIDFEESRDVDRIVVQNGCVYIHLIFIIT